MEIVNEMKVHKGICACSAHLLNTGWCQRPPEWITRRLKRGEHYFGPLPNEAHTLAQILSRLKLRVDILQKEIQLSK
jgi:hypothetical protein